MSNLPPQAGGAATDRIVALVLDAVWLHVYWEISPAAVRRAAAALGSDWYSAVPILRLRDVTLEDAPHQSDNVLQVIEIHGNANHWYVQVPGSPRTLQVDLGYRTPKGRLFILTHSNVVTTPKPGMTVVSDKHWEAVRQDCERIFAISGGHDHGPNSRSLRGLFEERIKLPLASGSLGDYGVGALGCECRGSFNLNIEAELIVHGVTDPAARVTLQNEPIGLRPDGTFTLRFSLPDGRQILPLVAQTHDGIEERTIILAIERNTKQLAPTVHDGQE